MFAGSGTTGEACILEGFNCILIEREAEYLPLIVQRVQRRRDPVAAVRAAGEDGGLFDLLDVDPTGESAQPRPERIANHHGTNGAAGVTYGARREYVPGSAGPENTHTKGRWPTNVVLDRAAAAELDEQSGYSEGRPAKAAVTGEGSGSGRPASGVPFVGGIAATGYEDRGGASRFFPVFDTDNGGDP